MPDLTPREREVVAMALRSRAHYWLCRRLSLTVPGSPAAAYYQSRADEAFALARRFEQNGQPCPPTT